MKSTQSPIQRINRVEAFYYKRGCNKESVNTIKRKILALKYGNKEHKATCD